jgi:hypothetical protein
MKTSASTPLRNRIIQEEAYTAAGLQDFAFKVPQPFSPAMFEEVAAELGISAHGFASQANQVLAENLGNNMASRVKKAIKDKTALPTQSDMDALVADYDFTGIRQSSIAIGSLFDKIFARLAGASIRKLLKASGYQGTPAPVTIAKRGKEAGASEIDYETFESEVSRLMEGEGPWGEKQAFVDLRQILMDEARAEEERVRANEAQTENKLSDLAL